MPDPRNTERPVTSGATHPFLDALRERVLVFDGAFGTFMQGHDLGPDDFGGEALEGCNEHLVLTRPDLVAQMHDEFFRVGVDGRSEERRVGKECTAGGWRARVRK